MSNHRWQKAPGGPGLTASPWGAAGGCPWPQTTLEAGSVQLLWKARPRAAGGLQQCCLCGEDEDHGSGHRPAPRIVSCLSEKTIEGK